MEGLLAGPGSCSSLGVQESQRNKEFIFKMSYKVNSLKLCPLCPRTKSFGAKDEDINLASRIDFFQPACICERHLAG